MRALNKNLCSLIHACRAALAQLCAGRMRGGWGAHAPAASWTARSSCAACSARCAAQRALHGVLHRALHRARGSERHAHAREQPCAVSPLQQDWLESTLDSRTEHTAAQQRELGLFDDLEPCSEDADPFLDRDAAQLEERRQRSLVSEVRGRVIASLCTWLGVHYA